jgi:hypothetical protein
VGDDGRFIVAVAPGQAMDDAQPLRQTFEFGGIVVDRRRQIANLGRNIDQLRFQPIDASGQRLEARIEPGEAADLATRDRDRLPRTTRFADQCILDGRRTGRDRLAMPRGVQAGPDLVRFTGPQARSSDLGGFVVEDLRAPGELSRIAGQLVEGCSIGAPAFHRVRDPLSLGVVLAERVEQIPLPTPVEQPLLLMLAVDLDQRPGCLRQACRGHRFVVQPGRRSTGRGHLAQADERLWEAVEERLDARGLGPVAHERRVRARPERQPQCVDNQALSGTGLPGQHVESRRELQPQPVDQREVGDGQLEQSTGPADVAGSIRRHRLGGHPRDLTTATAPPCGETGPRTAANQPAR